MVKIGKNVYYGSILLVSQKWRTMPGWNIDGVISLSKIYWILFAKLKLLCFEYRTQMNHTNKMLNIVPLISATKTYMKNICKDEV